MSSLKKLLATGILVGMNMPLVLPAAHAQITVTLDGVTANAPAKGRTESLNISQGARTTLAVGNGVQLGTSASMSSSVGTNSVSRSELTPTNIALSSSIGMTALLDADGDPVPSTTSGTGFAPNGKTTINIENITANGNGGTVNSQGGSTIDVAEGSKYASGNAVIDGMTAKSDIEVKSGDDGPGVAKYFASVTPEVKKESDPFYRHLLTKDGELVLDDDGNPQYLGDIMDKDGSAIATTDTDGNPVAKDEYDSDYFTTVNACAPDELQMCTYEDADLLKTGNASASSNYQTTTNIDINSSNFTNVFGQAF